MNGITRLFTDENANVRAKVIGIYMLLIGANVAAWLWALIAFHDYPLLLGTAALAYTFGLRHAFDADHIAAIDNVTRKLMQEGKRPVAVGFFFSLGHSTVVVALSIAIAITATALQAKFDSFTRIGGIIGTLVSAFFLFAIAAANVLVFCSIYKTFQMLRAGGRIVEEDLDLAPVQPWTAWPPVPSFFPTRRAQLAHVSAWSAFRPRLRHRDGSRPAGHFRDAGRARNVNLVDHGVPGPVHCRNVADGYER